MDSDGQTGWCGVRTVLRFGRGRAATYEERLTLWQAAGFAEAVALAETEAHEYADATGCAYAGLAQAYALAGAPGHGAEVFSLLRDSDLATDAYLSAFFDTGRERHAGAPGSGP